MKDLPVESADRSRLNQKVMTIDEEFRQDYLKQVKESGEELPNCMKPKRLTTKEYLEDNERRQKEKSALEAAKANRKQTWEEMKKEAEEEERIIEQEKELERERAYRRMEYWDNNQREAGVGGTKAAGIIPAATKPEEDKKSAGAVSGTDSESDAPQGK